MKNFRFEIEVSVMAFGAAVLTTFVLVSCAPTHRSFSLASTEASAVASSASQNPQPIISSNPSNALSSIVGEWVCDTESPCAVSDISILPDGSALADGRTAQLKLDEKRSQVIHITLSVPARDNVSTIRLQGDVNTTGNVNEITLGGLSYRYVAD